MLRLLSVSVLLVGAAAQASDNPAVTTQPKGAFPFSGSVSWGHSLGQGSFVQNYYARDARYVQSLGLSGSWRLPWKGYSVSASQSWSMELTQGGSMRNHELNYGDIGLRFGLPFGFKALGFSSARPAASVSKVSRSWQGHRRERRLVGEPQARRKASLSQFERLEQPVHRARTHSVRL